MQLVILDRDGVINEDSADFIKSPDEWQPLPGSLEAIAQLTNAGWRVVVFTNQSGIARKLFDIETLNVLHDKMHNMASNYGVVIVLHMFCTSLPTHQGVCRHF